MIKLPKQRLGVVLFLFSLLAAATATFTSATARATATFPAATTATFPSATQAETTYESAVEIDKRDADEEVLLRLLSSHINSSNITTTTTTITTTTATATATTTTATTTTVTTVTATVTTTTTTTATATTTTTNILTVDVAEVQIKGTISLSIPNAAAFIADAVAKQGVLNSIAKTVGVSPSEVAVSLTIEARRLSFEVSPQLGRKLATGDVIVAYTVKVQRANQAIASSVGSQVISKMNAISNSDLTSSIAKEILNLDLSRAYTITVLSKTTPTQTVAIVTVPVTTTSRLYTSTRWAENGAASKSVTAAVLVIASTIFC
eukprot:TRINITY_DN9979_c0_g4_i1.p1 TRINITY_DN9979_c0_g4~~TRINITY_DN9979_c0_g4_i1.p1  ORF type:complete len:320 (+),score=50.28 TRINITY_DN9979_c0_g4_i1:88-1047(+)